MRETYRSPMLNDKWEIITLQELIEWITMLNKDYPREIGKDNKYPVGLYIELKDYAVNLNYTGIDMAEQMNAILTRYGLGTVADCTDKMPIVVECFEAAGLDKYATLSDLPLVYLHSYSKTNTDWEAIAQKYHAIGPDS